MNLNEKEMRFIRKNINSADKLVDSNDYEGLIMALLDYTTFILMDTDDVPDEVRFAEQIADKVAKEKNYGQSL